MSQHRAPALLLAAFASLAAVGTAQADVFTWRPQAVGLGGEAFVADTFVLGDYARITFGFDGRNTTFLDRGFMPILGFTLEGEPVRTTGLNAPLGAGWGAYIDYVARGTQTFSPAGVPTSAAFTQLDYSIVGYNGAATFSLDAASSAPTISGNRSGVVTLGTGSLIGGALDFVPGPAGLTIVGTARTTIANVPPQLSGDPATGFDVTFVHPSNEYVFRSEQGAISIPGNGSSSTATVRTSGGTGSLAQGDSSQDVVVGSGTVNVPEPATPWIMGMGLSGLGLLRWGRARRPAR